MYLGPLSRQHLAQATFEPTPGGDTTNIPSPATAITATSPPTSPTSVYGTKKYGEPLFGPSIGSVSSGPGWTLAGEKKIVTDELTTEIVNGWIEKSKEESNPTTTLQALVNLKRPTLRLSPLASFQDDATNTDLHNNLHGLEFNYDCDAPKCGIYVYIHVTKDHPDAPPTTSNLARLRVFDLIQDGGFGNKLTFDDGAVLDLGRFEYVNGVAVVNRQDTNRDEEKKTNNNQSSSVVSTGADGLQGSDRTLANETHNNRRRLSFNFRKLQLQRTVTGPALAVVDAERNTASNATGTDETKATPPKSKESDGVKVIIRLVALDQEEKELDSPNEQQVYLHIVREDAKSDASDVDATVPWIVKVVKREATIGPHTFHLHEIYGLSSSNSGDTPIPVTHTYPPDASAVPQEDDDGLQSECLLCLSSPKEVVLLPCRHLVACKECALNMVEFGAGGNISYGSGTNPTASNVTDEGTVTGANQGGAGNTTPTATSPTGANARRKRKAKGWFCPVCREPYTSMLRLTTTAPSPEIVQENVDGDGSGSEEEGEGEGEVETVNNHGNNNNQGSTGGGFGFLSGDSGTGFFRNGFLRSWSGLGRERPADVENQNHNQNPNPAT